MFKRLLFLSAFICAISGYGFSQNLATVSGANIQDLNGAKLANGQICFLGTDQGDNPISFQIGGGGQALRRQYCAQISAGVIASFTVSNPAATSPTGIYYRVTVKDTSTGQEVLRYTGVTFFGGTFDFDTYTPNPPGFSPAPLSGTSVSGNLSVSGNVSATGTVSASNIPATIPGTGACANEFVMALNTAAPPTCSTAPLTTLGDIFYETSPAALGRVAGNTTTTKKFLAQTGTGTASAAPSWQQIAAADLSDGNTGTGSIVHGTSPAISSPTTTGTDNGTETLNNKTLASPTITGTDSGTETLNNKTLASPTSTGSDSGTETLQNKTLAGTTPFNRLRANQGSTLTSANFSLSAGWGSTASIGVAGADAAFVLQITANGTGLTANPSVTLTFHDGTWTNPPVCVATNNGTGVSPPNWSVSTSATTLVISTGPIQGGGSFSPVAASVYGIHVICVGK